MMGGGMMLWMLVWVVFGVALVLLAGVGVVWLLRRHAGARALERPVDPAIAELRRRYAAGEIDEDEYLRRRAGLD